MKEFIAEKRLVIDIIKLTIGSSLYVAGFNMIAASHQYVPSGAYGVTILIGNFFPSVSTSIIYLLVNIPLFAIAKWNVSMKFFLLNLYSMILMTILISLVTYQVPITDSVLSAIAAGAVMGTGLGIVYSSSGGSGGIDVITIIANIKYGIRIGFFAFIINAIIMLFAATQVSPDKLIASILMMFVSSIVSETTLSSFNTRKEMKIITSKDNEIMQKLIEAKIRGTVFDGYGMYSKQSRVVIMLIINNYQMKYIENIVFDTDPEAIMIVENTFNVIGKWISPRKKY